MELKFRNLKADEIECRVQQAMDKGVSLLLYKDARCDQNILDETVGALNWKKSYKSIDGKLVCLLEIWDEDKKQWIGKEDTGTESNQEAQKGEFSDAQKRAGFAWGIGRELYTSPFIWVKAQDCNIKPGNNGKPKCNDKFIVRIVETEDGTIRRLVIRNTATNKDVFSYGSPARNHLDELRSFTIAHRISLADVGKEFCFGKDTGDDDYKRVLAILKERVGE